MVLGAVSIAALIISAVAILDPLRTKAAGGGLQTFSLGFADVLKAPLEPIGFLGGQLSQLSTGLLDIGNVFAALVTFMASIIENIGGFTGINTTRSGAIVPPIGAPPINAQPLDSGQLISLALAKGIDPAGMSISAVRTLVADWADTPNTQFLENTLLGIGLKHG